MSEIRICDDHGPFSGGQCPVCETTGEQLLSSRRRTRVSKFLSGALRHFPDDVGLDLDDAGWADRSTVLRRATEKYDWVDERAIDAVVQTDPKGRFEVDGDRIRAAYGHSVPVALESGDRPVPAVLYHGTAPDNVPTILAEGLQPMSRQHVHLSGSVDAAREVGSRHAADPVVLRIDAAAMVDDDNSITKRGRDVYTTDHVPPSYLARHD
jgi:putative RNA 2'-phosphotransferase